MEEAGRDRSAGAVYVALLSRISPAEWNDLATLAFHLDPVFLEAFITVRCGGSRFATVPPDRNSRCPRPPLDVHLLRKTSLSPWTTRPGWRATRRRRNCCALSNRNPSSSRRSAHPDRRCVGSAA